MKKERERKEKSFESKNKTLASKKKIHLEHSDNNQSINIIRRCRYEQSIERNDIL